MASFSERLKELRREKGLTQKALADYLGLTERSYQNYEVEKTKPPYETQMKLAELFGVSLDYLTGRAKFRSSDKDEKAPSGAMAFDSTMPAIKVQASSRLKRIYILDPDDQEAGISLHVDQVDTLVKWLQEAKQSVLNADSVEATDVTQPIATPTVGADSV